MLIGMFVYRIDNDCCCFPEERRIARSEGLSYVSLSTLSQMWIPEET